jgi:hypothetical protein
VQPTGSTFVVKPYLQLGDIAPGHIVHELILLWHADDQEIAWAVEYRANAEASWRKTANTSSRRIAVVGTAPHRVYRTVFDGLTPGAEFAYRVCANGELIFAALARAPKAASQPYRFIAFGDCGAGTAEQKKVAFQAYLARPDFIMITGDIVYTRGRVSEYRDKFWPAYNADSSSPLVGAPLLRSTLCIAAPGNHDIASPDMERWPDGLAYFLYWDQPLNGPLGPLGARRPLVPPLTGPTPNKDAFIAAAGSTYPRMANFSFDYANAHWTVLDANPYVDWKDRDLRAWVERDLAAAGGQTWRFVAFHHPGFNSAKAHFDAQQMRLLADVFEAGHVDVVFSGHVHNYQRTFPLSFTSEKGPDGQPVREQNKVPGLWTLDKTFDGSTATQPRGVIYLITGAGGTGLYNPEQQDDPSSWQPFTHKFISKIHSLTVADVDGRTLTVRQLSADGGELDRFVVTK